MKQFSILVCIFFLILNNLIDFFLQNLAHPRKKYFFQDHFAIMSS